MVQAARGRVMFRQTNNESVSTRFPPVKNCENYCFEAVNAVGKRERLLPLGLTDTHTALRRSRCLFVARQRTVLQFVIRITPRTASLLRAKLRPMRIQRIGASGEKQRSGSAKRKGERFHGAAETIRFGGTRQRSHAQSATILMNEALVETHTAPGDGTPSEVLLHAFAACFSHSFTERGIGHQLIHTRG